MRSIKHEITLRLGAGIALLFVLLFTFVAVSVRQEQIAASEQYGKAVTADIADRLSADNAKMLKLAELAADAQLTGAFGKRAMTADYLRRVAERNPDVLGTYVGYEPGADGNDGAFRGARGADQSGRFIPYYNRLKGPLALDLLVGMETDDYYQLPKKLGRPVVVEPYLYGGVMMTSYVTPLLKDGRFVGITGVDRGLGEIQQRLKALKPYQSAAFLLLSPKGGVVAAPTDELLGKDITKDDKIGPNIKDLLGTKQAGMRQIKDPVSGKAGWMFYQPVQNGEWLLAMFVEQGEVLAAVNRMMWVLGLLAALGLGLIAGILLWLIGSAVKPMERLTEACEAIAEGDLSRVRVLVPETEEVKGQNEFARMTLAFRRAIGYLSGVAGHMDRIAHGDLSRAVEARSERDQLGVALSRMAAKLREVVGRVRSAADEVGAGAVQISSSSAELSQTTSVQASSAEETSAAMEEMAANLKSVDASVQRLGAKVSLVRGQSDALGAAVTQTSSSISELAASIQQVAGNVEGANRVAGEASEAANAGETAVGKTIAGMKAINATMDGIRETIQMLDQRSGEIGAIIEVIDDIAEQTNLLALNAAIEAARAGEAGRGFAVVADEVRKLAERSAKATKEIGDLIKGIQAETSQAVHVTQEGAGKVREGAALAERTGEALARIKQAASQVSSLLSEVTGATGEQARASSQIVTATEQMAAINDQVTGAVAEMDELTKTVTYATAEQRQGGDQVVLAVESLNRSAQEASAATSQVAGTADELSRQAHQLQEAVAFFQVDAEALNVKVPSAAKPLALPSRP
ncbi:HAMP domain-containing protein [bacterium]|nr:HAMP domain-containing protein [bacterium]